MSTSSNRDERPAAMKLIRPSAPQRLPLQPDRVAQIRQRLESGYYTRPDVLRQATTRMMTDLLAPVC